MSPVSNTLDRPSSLRHVSSAHDESSQRRTVYVAVPRDHDHVSLREILLDTVDGISKIYFAQGNLFLIFNNSSQADAAIAIMNDSLHIKAQVARTDLHDETYNPDQRRYSNEPSATLIISAPRFFTKDILERFLQTYPGFESTDGRKAHFSDAIWASKALVDLNSRTNLTAQFGRLSQSLEVERNGDERPKVTVGEGRIRISRSVEIRDIPRSSNFSLVKDMLGMLSLYRGFVKIAFQPGNVCFVDFADPESATTAISRIRATTHMTAVAAFKRPNDPGHFPLERLASALFVRLEPFLKEKDARALFNAMEGFQEIVAAGQNHCIVRFNSTTSAQEALEHVRRATNLVINYAKSQRRGQPSSKSLPSPTVKSVEVRHSADMNELPGVRVRNPPFGANTKEVFSIYDGFKRLFCDEDGSVIGLYESEDAAKRALAELRRSLISHPTLVRKSYSSYRPSDDVTPSAILYVDLHAALTEGQVKRLLSAYNGFVDFKAFMKTSGDQYGLVQYASLADAKIALEDLLATTNLRVNYSRKGETAFGASGTAGPKRRGSSRSGGSSALASRENVSTRLDEDEIEFDNTSPPQLKTSIVDESVKTPTTAGPKSTLHLTSPPPNKAALKNFLINQLGATRVMLKRLTRPNLSTTGGDYCFVLFTTADAASRAIPKIVERWPACSVDYARNEYVSDTVNELEIGKESKILYILTLYSVTWGELDEILREYEGYKELEYAPHHSRAYFNTVANARNALDDLNRTTGFQCAFSNVSKQRSHPDSAKRGNRRVQSRHSNGTAVDDGRSTSDQWDKDRDEYNEGESTKMKKEYEKPLKTRRYKHSRPGSGSGSDKNKRNGGGAGNGMKREVADVVQAPEPAFLNDVQR
ncbi:hypothetical protein SpCBS45565_g07060 [Spizellomyces sp. 'palustris']|nr:hypothetical protein SpCBS45565_g07060 [Spizellomyces sp. 'palustris']